MMTVAIPEKELITLLRRQLDSLFGCNDTEFESMSVNWGGVKKELEYCFSLTPNKYYRRNGTIYFNPFQSAQYTIFLYMMSRAVNQNEPTSLLADKIYYLNKTLNGCDMFYEVRLPRFFMLDHPVGSVMGRAEYGEGFSFGQCCTVGNNHGIYPVIGENVRMCAGASIIGNCHVGNNVTIGAYSGIKDMDIPDDTIVFGQYPDIILKKKK